MHVFNVFCRQKKQLIENSDCLKKGVYYLHRNLRTYLYLGTKHNVVAFPKGGYGVKHTLKLLIGRLFFTVRVSKDGKNFQADAVYFQNTGVLDHRDAKLFLYRTGEKVVLTRCIDQQSYRTYMNNRIKASNAFPIPELIFNDNTSAVYIERIVNGICWRGNEDLTKQVYYTLFDFYKRYYSNCYLESYALDESERCSQPLDVQEPDECSAVLHHGDLSSDNFKMTEEGKIVFFDFEHADIFPLYYDVFFLIFNEAAMNDNFIGYNLLLNGKFDKYFNSKAERKNYLVAFMHCFWHVRLGRINSDTHKKLYLNLYKDSIRSDD